MSAAQNQPRTEQIREAWAKAEAKRLHPNYTMQADVELGREAFNEWYESELRVARVELLNELVRESAHLGTSSSGHTSTYSVRSWLKELVPRVAKGESLELYS